MFIACAPQLLKVKPLTNRLNSATRRMCLYRIDNKCIEVDKAAEKRTVVAKNHVAFFFFLLLLFSLSLFFGCINAQ